MCGLCGVFYADPERPVDPAVLGRMARSMRHRGPDGEGFYHAPGLGLGHQRLSVIDLSERAAQPMTNGRGLWIVYNGEVYNYLELRQFLAGRGYAFETSSDTEVLLLLYEELGPACLEKLNGMFAFAIWDEGARELFLARDRLGIKPLYYLDAPGRFAFASEIKALLHAGLVAPEVCEQGLADYLTFQWCLGEKTLFRGVRSLEPGTWLKVGAQGIARRQRYWSAEFEVEQGRPESYFEHHLLRLLEDAVRLQIRSDVPLGAHLSGGLDSSTVATLASSMYEGLPLRTFAGGFREPAGYDETRHARTVADAIHSEHVEVFPSAADFVDVMPRLIYALDEPLAGPGAFPQYCVSRAAKERVKVVLTGHGGDEVFGGYARYLVLYLEHSLKGAIEGTHEAAEFVVSLQSIVPNLAQLRGYQPLLQYLWQGDLFGDEERRYFRLIDRSEGVRPFLAQAERLSPEGYSPYEAFREAYGNPRHDALINRMTCFDMQTLLRALLQVEDRVDMANSLEGRVPLLDHRIVELAVRMPPKVKFNGGRAKHVLRRATRNLLPPEVHGRVDKMGFPVPLAEWARGGAVRDFLGDVLLGDRARQRGFVNTARLESQLTQERAYGRGLWGLLCLELWHQTFLDGALPESVT
ncbi:MAG: asparagine synthase (glutamine-hydrolyzing) [Planctomycetes bacterium]|nr:asparagine synthase (glutamine-hydrolyzing) [Planctomycetota bacterium]